jgi:hypothetical protein
MLGDRRLVHQLTLLHGIAYLKDAERPGPSARWAGQPTQRKGPSEKGAPAAKAPPEPAKQPGER